jgi:hypothetical protein
MKHLNPCRHIMAQGSCRQHILALDYLQDMLLGHICGVLRYLS